MGNQPSKKDYNDEFQKFQNLRKGFEIQSNINMTDNMVKIT